MQVRSLKTGVALGLLLLLLSACGSSTPDQPARLQGQIFGTFWLVTLPGDWSSEQLETLRAGILEQLNAVDASMSTYRQDSELNQLNQLEIGEWMPVSAPLFDVLLLSQRVAEASGGSFDVTVGGLVNLWNFGPEARADERPSAEVLASRLSHVGHAKLELDMENRQARRQADFFVDLSGVAKGYAVDQVARWLSAQGVDHFLLNIGGDLVVAGERALGQPWRIGVEVPDGSMQVARHILPLTDLSVATSGDYRNYFEQDGRRYSHTLDPRSGEPVDHHLASVTVIHPSNAVADAWATAIMVLGTEEGLAVAEAEGLAVLLISRRGEHWETQISSALRSLFSEDVISSLLE